VTTLSRPLSRRAVAFTFESALPVARALFELTKPRLAFFSILTALATYAATAPISDGFHALMTFLGTALAAGGALSLNQWWERDTDRLMRRTRQRPLPLETLSPSLALTWSLSLSVSGVVLLFTLVAPLAAVVAGATILVYGVWYTPWKRRTRWATEIGSISGALPALLGGAAAGDPWSAPAWNLTAILLCWQMPHFFAIGWMHRADYRAAGFPLLPAIDPTGARTAYWSLGYTVLLVVVSLMPVLTGHFGWVYAITAAAAGAFILQRARRFVCEPAHRDLRGRQLFLASIIYLPVVMIALVVDRCWM
jgi:heme o synthase